MTKRLYILLLTISFLFANVVAVPAQTGNRAGGWDALNSNLNNKVAVKSENQKIVFGILSVADADGLTVRTSNKNNVLDVSFKREDVEKIWLAELNSSSRNTLKGAGIGAATGAGIGAAALLANRDNRGGAYGAAVPFYAVVGAVVGGAAGFFVRKKNKKERLIYQK